MNIKTIAEFTCSDDVIKQFKQMGVDYAQGYAVGEPIAITAYQEDQTG